jgi:hypothetical protein
MGPLAYGRALVTRIRRLVIDLSVAGIANKFGSEGGAGSWAVPALRYE